MPKKWEYRLILLVLIAWIIYALAIIMRVTILWGESH